DPALREQVAHRMGGGLELVARAGHGWIDNAVEPQVPLEQRIGLAGKSHVESAMLRAMRHGGCLGHFIHESLSRSGADVRIRWRSRARSDETTHPRAYPPSRRQVLRGWPRCRGVPLT